MIHDISHEESLILNFFNSEVYFVFENQEEVESFLNYIKFYDPRFEGFTRKNDIKSAAWMYSKTSHRLQLEWGNSEDYFKERYFMKPISYSIVRKITERETKLRKFFDVFKDIITGEDNAAN